MIGDKIFPIIAENDTTYPFITLTNESVNPEYTKSGCLYDSVDFSAKIVATSYQNMIDIAEKVRDILENKSDNRFTLIRVSNIGSDDFNDDAYSKEISFNANFKR